MKKPVVHLICNAHLDPVWQWRWEEGCGEALSTFHTAVEMLREHPGLIFNHNEAVLYRWVQQHDPKLFAAIVSLAAKGRWSISGGWFLQPDVNIPGTESLIRHIAEGRRFFRKYFHVEPAVAYNFDSFGHSGGLPQILRKAGYRMYIHMRPQQPELPLPSDLYRWRGVDGTEILVCRISVGLYHTERGNMEQRLREGTDLALKLGRDVPVFWGIGDHGGGATRKDLAIIDAFIKDEKRVTIRHSTTDKLYKALKPYAADAPIVNGDLQRVFTGCYTSLARIKQRQARSLGEVLQSETLAAAAWWKQKLPYPQERLGSIWRDHMFNDFHDILPGSCTEPAEFDALDLYGTASVEARRVRLSAVTSATKGTPRHLYIPITVANTNPGNVTAPVEVECMLDLRPQWTGQWHLRLFDLTGRELACQEEQPECLLPFNGWRRKVCFQASLPTVGMSFYELRMEEGAPKPIPAAPTLRHTINPSTGFVDSMRTNKGHEILDGSLMQPIVVNDDGDSWGADTWSYRTIEGSFSSDPLKHTVLHDGPIRKTTESVLTYRSSRIIQQVTAYRQWPVLEYRLRIQWNEEHKRLKLSIPTTFTDGIVMCEVPGGTITRPADGQEHVQSRWCMIADSSRKKTAIGIVNSGQNGFDFEKGELRISVLRGAAYCHEQSFVLGDTPSRKVMDQGIHEIRLLVTLGDHADVLSSMNGLADWLHSPPYALAHLPIGEKTQLDDNFLTLQPHSLRLLACKQSWDKKALIVRLQETTGRSVHGTLDLFDRKRTIDLTFTPFEIKTLRIERNGRWHAVDMIEER